MLAAMGYQQGQGLGKGQVGRAAPVPVQFKAGKHGLGIEENRKRKVQQIERQQQDRGKLQQSSASYISHLLSTCRVLATKEVTSTPLAMHTDMLVVHAPIPPDATVHRLIECTAAVALPV